MLASLGRSGKYCPDQQKQNPPKPAQRDKLRTGCGLAYIGAASIFAAVAAAIALAPTASADPFDMNCGYVTPCGPSVTHGPWNGQLQPTWDTPGWGGLTSGPQNCYALQCTGAIPNPNR